MAEADQYEDGEALHAEAMRHANDAMAYRYLGKDDEAHAAFREAWRLERQAAMGLIGDMLEPSRSILFRSAASLALLCGEVDDAQKLAHLGLGGAPSLRVRESLQTILADAAARVRAGTTVYDSVSDELEHLQPNAEPIEPIDVTWKRSA